MATIQHFEELEVWQRARTLTKEIYAISKQSKFSKDFALRNQIIKACISIMSNITEGFERNGTKEFIQFLAIAKGSVGEVRSQLYISMDQNYIPQKTFTHLNEFMVETGRMIGGLMNYLRKSRIKGNKFKQQ
jgi:four helix bundle protein